VAQELIVGDEINLMLVAPTPETTNPVTTVCKAEGMPVISTIAPWRPFFIGKLDNPGDPTSWRPFNFAYHYFWGLQDVIDVFTSMWNRLDTNKQVGGLFSPTMPATMLGAMRSQGRTGIQRGGLS